MNITPQKYRWFSRTPNGWYERFNIQFTNDEKIILDSGDTKLLNQFQKLSVQKIDPPQNVQEAFLCHHDPHSELIMANINDQGHGTIHYKKNNQYYKITL